MKRIATLFGTLLVLVPSATACSTIDQFQDHYTDTTPQKLTTDLNHYMQIMVPDWTNVPVPGDKVTKLPCAALNPSTMMRDNGPPWTLGIHSKVHDLTPGGWDALHDRIDALKREGFTEEPPPPPSANVTIDPRARRINSATGYHVDLTAHQQPVTNTEYATITVTSPCVRYPGDE